MTKFNLNDYILVQITEYGWKELRKQKDPDYIKYCIEDYEELIDGEKWYRMQAHMMIETFGNMLWIASHSPIKSNILIF